MIRLTAYTHPHHEQRYDTVGDYFVSSIGKGGLVFRVSNMTDWRSEVGVLVHEMVEAFLCQEAGVTLGAIDKFDMVGPGADCDGEPGDLPDCPYREQHRFAENIERLLIAQLGLAWADHEENVNRAAEESGSGGSAGQDRRVRQGGRGLPGDRGGRLSDQEGGEGARGGTRAAEDGRCGYDPYDHQVAGAHSPA